MMRTPITLALLQRLSDEGRTEELDAALQSCYVSRLLRFCMELGERPRSKEHEEHRDKDGFIRMIKRRLASRSRGRAPRDDDPPTPPPPAAPACAGATSTQPPDRPSTSDYLRLLNVMISEEMAPFLVTESTRPGSDILSNNELWRAASIEFVRRREDYATIQFPDNCFEDHDLTSPQHLSAADLREMWQDLVTAHQEATSSAIRTGNNEASFLESCGGRCEVYYFELCLGVQPLLLPAPQRALPENMSLSSSPPPQPVPSSLPPPTEEVDPSTRRLFRTTNMFPSRGELMGSVWRAGDMICRHMFDPASDAGKVISVELTQSLRLLRRIQMETALAEQEGVLMM